MKTKTAIGRCKKIDENFIYLTSVNQCFAYRISDVGKIKCSAFGNRPLNFSKTFNKIFLEKRVKLIFKEEEDVR